MAKPGQGAENSEGEMAAIAAILLLTVATVVIWVFFRAPIVYAVFGMNWVQVKIIELVKGGLGPVGSRVNELIVDTYTGNEEAARITWNEMTYVMDAVGQQSRYVIAAMIVGMAVWVLFRMRGEGLKHSFDLSGLADYQATHWKVALAGSEFDPDKAKPESAPAWKPLEWIVKENVPHTGGKFDKAEATKAFSRQLGDIYVDIHKLPTHTKALAVLFGIARKRDKRVQGLKETLTEIWVLDRKNAVARTEEILKPFLTDAKLVETIEKHLRQHAYVNTAMTYLFEVAKKEGGVLACAEIRWLKPLDRALWYSFQNIGRHAYFIEGAGSRAHFFAERVGRSPKIEPYVETALDGLESYLEKQGVPDAREYYKAQVKPD